MQELVGGMAVPITGIVNNTSVLNALHSATSVDDNGLRTVIGTVKEMLKMM